METFAVFKTVAAISGDPEQEGFVLRIDTIRWRGHWWLVGSWHAQERTAHASPAVLARPLAGLQEQPPADRSTARFLAPGAVPRSALDGAPTPGWEVLRLAPVPTPAPRDMH